MTELHARAARVQYWLDRRTIPTPDQEPYWLIRISVAERIDPSLLRALLTPDQEHEWDVRNTVARRMAEHIARIGRAA